MQKWPFWPNLSHFFGQICHCGSFPATLVWNDLKKLENSKNLPMYPSPLPEMKIFEISPKMRRFGGKRWEKLWIRWNWPFRVNLSLILGEKIEKYAKMAILTQSKPLFGQICHCGSFPATLVWNDLKKLEKSKNLPMYPPPRNENFWDFSKNETLWCQVQKLYYDCILNLSHAMPLATKPNYFHIT